MIKPESAVRQPKLLCYPVIGASFLHLATAVSQPVAFPDYTYWYYTKDE